MSASTPSPRPVSQRSLPLVKQAIQNGDEKSLDAEMWDVLREPSEEWRNRMIAEIVTSCTDQRCWNLCLASLWLFPSTC